MKLAAGGLPWVVTSGVLTVILFLLAVYVRDIVQTISVILTFFFGMVFYQLRYFIYDGKTVYCRLKGGDSMFSWRRSTCAVL